MSAMKNTLVYTVRALARITGTKYECSFQRFFLWLTGIIFEPLIINSLWACAHFLSLILSYVAHGVSKVPVVPPRNIIGFPKEKDIKCLHKRYNGLLKVTARYPLVYTVYSGPAVILRYTRE